VPTLNSDKQWSFNKKFLTDNTQNILYNNNPIVQIWGAVLETKYAFSRNLKSSMTFSLEKRNFPVGRREDVLLGAGLSTVFNITRFNTISFFYEFKRNWSHVPEATLAEGEAQILPIPGADENAATILFDREDQNYDYLRYWHWHFSLYIYALFD